MADTSVAHVSDVHQSIDTSEVDENTVRRDVLDRALQNLSNFEALNDQALLLFKLSLNQGLVRHDDILVLLVDFDHLELHLLADVLVEVTDGLDVHLGARQESLQTKHVHNESTLGAALDRTLDDHVLFFGFVHLVPSIVDPGRLVAHHELTIGILLLLDEHWNLVANFQLRVVAEFRCANDAFGLVADVDHNFLLANGNNGTFHHLFLGDEGQARFVQTLQALTLF